MNIKYNTSNKVSEFINSLLEGFNPISIDGKKIIVLDNLRLEKAIQNETLKIANFEKEYFKYLDYGLVIIINEDNTIHFYNDIYGAYPLFIKEEGDNSISLSNVYSYNENDELNEKSLIQLIHFNHLLSENTLDLKTKRLKGGNKLTLSEKRIDSVLFFSWDDFLREVNKTPKKEPSYYLSESIESALNKKNISLTLTGGFDSRLLLAVMLKSNTDFKTITWGLEDNLQTSTAANLSAMFNKKHIDIKLDESFLTKIEHYLNYMKSNSNELPFITDIPQFIYMCENLEKGENLISGFMGSEIVRGPSYSSQVTLTKFASDVCLSSSKSEIKDLIYSFNKEYPFIKKETLDKHIDSLVDEYSVYSKIGINSKSPNTNIFKYLFYEKYAKIYGLILNYHFKHGVNLINPYMDFNFIASMFSKNAAFTKMTPYQNSTTDNFLLYRLYAKEIKNTYPSILKTKLDRGYYVKDLINIFGIMKLVPFQVYRKFKKKSGTIKKVVDSYSWYEEIIQKKLREPSESLKSIVDYNFIQEKLKKNNLNDLEKIKLQLILSATEKLND